MSAPVFVGIALVCHLTGTAVSKTIVQSFAGPFDVVPEHVELCASPMRGLDRIQFTRVKLTRSRRSPRQWTCSGRVDVHYNLSDDITLRLRGSAWSSRGGWRDNYWVNDLPRMCSTLKRLFPLYWALFSKYIFGHEQIDCPAPPFAATVNDAPLYLNQQNIIKEFVYGRWKGDLLFIDVSRNNAVVGCISSVMRTVPRSDLVYPGDNVKPNYTGTTSFEFLVE